MKNAELKQLIDRALFDPHALAIASQKSRDVAREIALLAWWRPRRVELWNQYITLRNLHKIYHNLLMSWARLDK